MPLTNCFFLKGVSDFFKKIVYLLLFFLSLHPLIRFLPLKQSLGRIKKEIGGEEKGGRNGEK